MWDHYYPTLACFNFFSVYWSVLVLNVKLFHELRVDM